MGIFRSVLDYIESFQPGSDKVRRDLETFRENLKDHISGLIPLSGSELELLSQNRSSVEVKKRFSYRVKGIINSIYHEPMVAYAMKEYRSGKRNYLLYVRSREREYIFRIKPSQTMVYLNGTGMGTIAEDSKLYGGPKKRLIAQLLRSEDKYWPIVVLDSELANLVNPGQADSVNPRAFYFMREMDRHEEDVVLALGLYALIIASPEFRG